MNAVKAKRNICRTIGGSVPLCCGFLLTRGLAGGARCAAWSMPALTGSMWGSLSGAVLFAAACAVYRIARRDLGSRAAWLLQPVTAAVYTLHCLCVSASSAAIPSLLDGGAVSIALLLTGSKRASIPHIVLMLMLALARLLPPLSASPEILLRLSAITGGLSSAWMCGAAACSLVEGEKTAAWRLLTIGAAAGMIQA